MNDPELTPRTYALAAEAARVRLAAAKRGYDLDHDREHGVEHVLKFASGKIQTARILPGPRRTLLLEAVGLLLAAIDLHDHRWEDQHEQER